MGASGPSGQGGGSSRSSDRKAKKDLENFKSKSVTEQEAQYKSYLDGRLSGKTDAMGRDTPKTMAGIDAKSASAEKGMVGKNILVKQKKTEEKKSTEEKKEATEYDARKTKKKGRRKNVLTSQQGVTKLSSDYSLSNKTLLGRTV